MPSKISLLNRASNGIIGVQNQQIDNVYSSQQLLAVAKNEIASFLFPYCYI